jgi:hypothetical protein
VFSAAAGEAFINEIGELGSHADLASEPAEVRNVATLIQEVENAKGRTTLKFHVAKLAITGKIFEKGSQPFDEFSLLMKLRNSLLHLEFE